MEGNEQEHDWIFARELEPKEAQEQLREGATNVFELGVERRIARVIGFGRKGTVPTAETLREKIETETTRVITDPSIVEPFLAAIEERQRRSA